MLVNLLNLYATEDINEIIGILMKEKLRKPKFYFGALHCSSPH